MRNTQSNRRSRQPEQICAHDKKRDTKARRGQREKEGFGEVVPLRGKGFKAKNDNQKRLYSLIKAKVLTIATGPGGTGKTHVALEEGVEWLLANSANILVLTTPGVEISEKLGTLPGEKDDKIAPSVRPMRDILNKLMGRSHVDNLVNQERIMFEHLGSILGTTFDDALMVMDEAQNSTPAQMKAFLTRLGQRSRVVVAGDYKEQKFIEGESGLEDILKRMGRSLSVGHVDFTVDDIVRHGFVKELICTYRDESIPDIIAA